MVKRKVVSITNPYQDSSQVAELEHLLNEGWNIVSVEAIKYAFLYVLEKDEGPSETEIKLKIANETIKTEMLKEIIKRDKLLKNYKNTVHYLKTQNCMIGSHTISANFDRLDTETEELLSSEIWED